MTERNDPFETLGAIEGDLPSPQFVESLRRRLDDELSTPGSPPVEVVEQRPGEAVAGPNSRWRYIAVGAVAAAALILGIIASLGRTRDPVITSDSTPTAGPRPTEVATSTPAAAPTGVAPLPSIIPTSSDPCRVPADHVTGKRAEYEFELDGQRLPVGFNVGVDTLSGPATLWVALHALDTGWGRAAEIVENELGEIAGPPESTIIVAPEAPGQSWLSAPGTNVDYLTSLFATLERSFCLEEMTVILLGDGQGAIPAVQVICEADLPIDVAILREGLITLEAPCQPTRAVPIVSLDQLEPSFGYPVSWYDSWTPPDEAIPLVGTIGPIPDELATWATIYRCADAATEELLPDPDDVLELDTIVASHRDCDAPITALGLDTQIEVVGSIAVNQAKERLRQELQSALEQ